MTAVTATLVGQRTPLRAVPDSTAVGSGASPFVGRDAPLAALVELIDRAAAGDPAVVLVAGPAGVGKSRLVREALDARPGARGLLGGAAAVGGEDLSYGPITAALRRLAPQWPPEHSAAGSAGRLEVLESLLELLDELGREQPTVLVLEDLHWSDASTRGAVDYLARNLTTERALVVATYRDDALPRGHPMRAALGELVRLDRVELVTLDPLDVDGTAVLVAHEFGVVPDGAVVVEIHARGHGIPFFTEELARAAAVGDRSMPHTLSAVLEAQVNALPDDVLRVVRVAALAGANVPPERVAALAGVPAAVAGDALRAAVDAGFLVVGEGELTFRHALQREAVEATLLPSERRALHAAIATALEVEPPSPGTTGAVARHRYLAGDVVGAHEAALHAADLAEAARDPLGAAGLLELALETWPDPAPGPGGGTDVVGATRLADVLVRTAELALDAGEAERAVSLARRAIARLDAAADVDRTVRAATVLVDALGATLDYAEAWSEVSAVLDLARLSSPRRAAALLTSAVRLAAVTGRARAARSLAAEAVDAARRSRSAVAEARALGAAGVAAVTVGEVEQGFALFERSEELARAEHESRVAFTARLDHVHVLYFLGRHARCEALGTQAVDDARRLGLARSLTPAISGLAALSALHDARVDAASRCLDGQAHEAPGLGGILLDLARARLALQAGDVARCRHLLDRSLERGGAGLRVYAADWGAVRLECALVEPDPVPGALRAAWVTRQAEGFALLGTGWWLASRSAAVRTTRFTGDPALAEACAEIEGRVRELSIRIGVDAATPAAAVWRDVSRAFDGHEPDGGWDAARRRALAAEVAAEAAWLDLAGAATRLAGGDRDGAAVLLARLLEADTVGPVGSVAAELAARARLSTPAAGQRDAASAHDVTARELDVIRLVAEGLTNREIADRLYISPKTVSVHLSNLMRKLDVDDRRSAAVVARRLGLVDPPA